MTVTIDGDTITATGPNALDEAMLALAQADRAERERVADLAAIEIIRNLERQGFLRVLKIG